MATERRHLHVGSSSMSSAVRAPGAVTAYGDRTPPSSRRLLLHVLCSESTRSGNGIRRQNAAIFTSAPPSRPLHESTRSGNGVRRQNAAILTSAPPSRPLQ
ncbi:hypothetical protein EVAR_37085_1 [Eumeta japonica]|uniref:Uncharacterized protein n=1 Tax=Eumeta variegata TaxID=151549 RepID=A0A4C1WI00_EUMVA|nr:hypothetical protein EVAR_37085_1 [Eumeta japonica]